MNEFKPPIPILRSFNEQATKAFYLDFLGFEIVFEHRLEPETPLYFGIKRDNCHIHLSEHFGDAAPGATLRIQIADVHEYSRILNAKNYKHAQPGVQNQTWGEAEMAISDPSGNKIIFCTPTA